MLDRKWCFGRRTCLTQVSSRYGLGHWRNHGKKCGSCPVRPEERLVSHHQVTVHFLLQTLKVSKFLLIDSFGNNAHPHTSHSWKRNNMHLPAKLEKWSKFRVTLDFHITEQVSQLWFMWGRTEATTLNGLKLTVTGLLQGWITIKHHRQVTSQGAHGALIQYFYCMPLSTLCLWQLTLLHNEYFYFLNMAPSNLSYHYPFHLMYKVSFVDV